MATTFPIWRDTYADLGTSDSYQYEISKGADTIYQGTSVKAPGASHNLVLLNDIVADHLDYPVVDFHTADAGHSITERWHASAAVTVDPEVRALDYVALGDWSYGSNPDAAYYDGHRCPINNVVLPFSVTAAPGTMVYPALAPGQSATLKLYLGGQQQGTTITLTPGATGTTVFCYTAPSSENVHMVFDGDFKGEFVTQEICNPYVFLYRNLYGGIDQFICTGKAIKSEKYGWQEGTFNGMRRQYLNEVTHRWKVSTPFLTDEQAKRMPNLLGSTDILMADPLGNVYNVVMAGNAYTEKNHSNDGMVAYSFEVELAQTRTRR